MVDLADILGSEELAEAIEAFGRTARAYAHHRKPIRQPAFSKIALGKTFQADKAAAIVSNGDPSYPGICEVLFLGFCGWAVSPDQDTARSTLMRHGC